MQILDLTALQKSGIGTNVFAKFAKTQEFAIHHISLDLSHQNIYAIVSAFAELRPYIPLFSTWSERSIYNNFFNKDAKKLEQRLVLDIEGTLKTAALNNINVLDWGNIVNVGCTRFDRF